MFTHFSRRTFLKNTAAISCAATVSALLTGCALPNLDDWFGPKFQTIQVPEGYVRIALVGYSYDSHCQDARPKFLIENRTSSPVVICKGGPNPNNCYSLVPSVKYRGLSGVEVSVDYTKSTLKTIAIQEKKEGDLVICMAAVDNWSAIEVTLTLQDSAGNPVDEPAVFTANT